VKWEKTLVLNKFWEGKVATLSVDGSEEKIGCVVSRLRNRHRNMSS